MTPVLKPNWNIPRTAAKMAAAIRGFILEELEEEEEEEEEEAKSVSLVLDRF